MKKYRAVLGVAFVVAALALLGSILLRDVHFDILQPAGNIAKQQRDLIVFTLGLMGIIVIPIFIMLGWFGWKYRAGNDKRSKHDYKPEWHENTTLELLWWGIPIAVISILAVIAWNTSHSLDPYKQIESDKAAIKVQVVALQWKWLFIYPQLGVATVNKLPIPEKTPIHFTISADAPMSAFWVPTLGSQIYAMNGMSTQLNLIADRTGEFTGVSSNINGKGYADMKFTVYSKTEKDFNEWVKSAQNSANMLDRTMYERLAQPGVTNEATYMLTDASLYDTIVNKYMRGMSHGSSDSGTHVMPDGTVMKNSDMQKQEHMEGM